MADRFGRAMQRELGGEDRATERIIDRQAIPPTPERQRQIRTQLARVAEHLSAAHRIVPRVEELAVGKRITPNMLTAARYYAVLSQTAQGKSQGISNYGDGGKGSPAWSRSMTSDERLMLAQVFAGAVAAAFAIRDRTGRWVIDEEQRHALEPLLLGSDQSWTMEEIGRWLSSYRGEKSNQAAGTQEVVAVLRRLRLYFRLADDA